MSRRKSLPEPLTPEWSRRLDVADIGVLPYKTNISATELECADMARRLHVDSIRFLGAEFMLSREAGSNVVHVQGTVKAAVIQPCIVSLEKVEEAVTEDFEAWYADSDAQVVSLARARHERLSRLMDAEVPMLDEKEDPESVVNGQIDLGELAAQYLSLAVNPYPQAQGAFDNLPAAVKSTIQTVYSTSGPEEAAASLRRNPFAALKAWKGKKGRDNAG